MLPLNLPGIVVERTETIETGDTPSHSPLFAIHAGCEGKPDACPHCNGEALYAHGTHNQDISDIPHQGQITCIHLARKRWKCRGCGATFFHPLEWIDDDHRATTRFVNRIADLSLERNFSDLSREFGVNEKTIRNIFYRRYQPVIDKLNFESPAYLGIDEVNIAGAARGVITNLSINAAIEFLPACTNEAFRAYFEKMPDRGNIKAVAMDCTKRYKDMAHEFFPQARIIADKYHITRMANVAIDEIRKDVRANIDSKRMKLRLKKDQWTLKTRQHNLDDWQKAKLAEWRYDFPLLGTAYDIKEEFYRIYDAGSRREAKLRFDTWRAAIPGTMSKYWQPILTTWGNWEEEILAFFDIVEASDRALTNAYTECQNGLTRAIDRLGRGYSFDALRVKLLLAPKKEGAVTSYRSIRRKKASDPSMHRFMSFMTEDDEYETVKVPERRLVTWGVDIAKLADWLEEQERQVSGA